MAHEPERFGKSLADTSRQTVPTRRDWPGLLPEESGFRVFGDPSRNLKVSLRILLKRLKEPRSSFCWQLSRRRRHSCPSCTQPVSRWRIWNSVASGKCDCCGEKLWLELPQSFRFVLFFGGLSICGIWWALSEWMGTGLNFMLLIMPLALTGLSCWMQIVFGRLVSDRKSVV